MNLLNHRGNFSALSGAALSLVCFGIILAVGASVLNELAQGLPANSTAVNVTNLASEGLESMAAWTPIVVIAIVGAIVIGIVAFYFGGMTGGPKR